MRTAGSLSILPGTSLHEIRNRQAGLSLAMSSTKPVKVILDTDMGGGGCQDCDDVGTLCAANAMADAGEIERLGIVLNTLPKASAATIGVLQHHYGREVPVGAYKGKDNGILSGVSDYAE